ncbi:MAG: PHP domain-containing protein [Bacilli bacterium]|nr:PHP domain-containing protein [Bacilli bacterium]
MIDMHIHTINSDGENTVSEIIKLLKNNNINIFSITDHDNIDSCLQIENIQLPSDMIFMSGVEFSAKLNNYKCHILGYNIDYNKQCIINECKTIKERRTKKIHAIINNLYNNFGINITKEEKNKILNKQGVLGRTDLYKILLNKIHTSKTEIYDKYLTVPDGFDHRSSAKHIVDIIHNSNGKAILAHPKEIETDYNICFEQIIKLFLNIGIDGIETFNSIHELNDVKRYLELAKKYNLLTTGGSDYHGTNIRPEVKIGHTTTKKIKIYPNHINFHK